MAAAAPPPTPLPATTQSCARPNAPPRIVHLVRPIGARPYLETYHKPGIVDVQITLDETGAVTKALIVHSSGDPILDGASYDAATATTYAPEIRDCEAVSGAYIYRVKYNQPPR